MFRPGRNCDIKQVIDNKMPKVSKKIILLGILAIGVLSIFTVKSVVSRSTVQVHSKEPARVKGNDNAPVKITEYVDFQCPSCAEGAKYLKEIMDKYPGKIRLEVKYYPLILVHRHALLSAYYAECAARQGRFWSFYDYFFEHQAEWSNLTDAKPFFDRFARKLGLNLAGLETCLQDENVYETVRKSKDEGKLLKVSSTPTYFINGSMVVGKKQLAPELEKFLNETKN